RQLDVLDRRLSETTYLAGGHYSIADIAVWSWYGQLVLGNLYNAAEFLAVHEYPNVQRWAQAIAARPAVQRGTRVNRTWGDESSQVPERHSAAALEVNGIRLMRGVYKKVKACAGVRTGKWVHAWGH
ncbi:hypothetical protein NS212_08655, partial [Pseudomonas parafulva]